MKHTLYTLIAASLFTLAGCGGSDPAPAPEPEKTAASEAPAAEAAPKSEADKLMDVAKAVRANPANADKILAEAGMSLDQFEAAMYELAKDPAKSQAFVASMM